MGIGRLDDSSWNEREKKISDILIERKITLKQKESIYVMLSEDRIAWLIGIQIDDRFKVTESTQEIISFTRNEF